MMRARQGQAGFTLLEILLATAISALIGLVLFSAMSIGFRARTSASDQTRAVRQAGVVLDLIKQDLQSAVVPRGQLAGPFIGYAMGTAGAEADSLQFHTLGRDADDGPFSDGIRRVQFALRTDVSPTVLVRRVERNLLSVNPRPPLEEVLARDVHAFAVRYYNGFTWSQEWDSSVRDDRLPLAVEVTIELNLPSPADASRRYRAWQIVPLSVGLPADPEEEFAL
jgi:type II secretion system protein J